MKNMVCSVCGFISLDAIVETCPVCSAPKDKFVEKENAYKTPEYVEQKGESEKKHIPHITVVQECGLIPGGVCRDVHVKIGEIEHPMLPEHHITDIFFYLDKKYIGSSILTAGALHPAAALHLKSKGKLSVIEFCNLHGAWISEVDII